MARSEPQVNVRMPAELKDALDQAAAENKRSLTAEVVARLQASFGEGATIWARTFPGAAAAASGDRTYQEAIAALVTQQMEEAQLRDRFGSLQTQLMSLDTQAVSLQRELLRMQSDLEQADAHKEGKVVATLLKQQQLLTQLLRQRDAQAKAVKAAMEETRQQLETIHRR